MGPDLVLYFPQVTATNRFHNSTNPLSPTVHWEAFTDAIRRDGLSAIVHLRQIRDAASAKLLSVTCNLRAISSLNLSTV